MASFLRQCRGPGKPWKPLVFANTNFRRVPLGEKLEEEALPEYVASRFFPAQIGQVLRERYQIVGKLGYGMTSTVWLARDLAECQHVALKVYLTAQAMGPQLDSELAAYQRMSKAPASHPGRSAVRQLLDSFDVAGPDGSHRCLVHPPMWENLDTFIHRNPAAMLPSELLRLVLYRLFNALDFLHTECQIIHTDLKADNIMFGVGNTAVFDRFEQQELADPSPRKVGEDGRVVYKSLPLPEPISLIDSLGPTVLCDFGAAVSGDVEHREDVQPDVYRSPEVILDAPWSYPVDMWNAGCMVWNIYEGRNLFSGYDPEFETYRSRAHLCEIVSVLGDPPQSLLRSGALSNKFFTEDGKYIDDVLVPVRTSIGKLDGRLGGRNKEQYEAMMEKLLA